MSKIKLSKEFIKSTVKLALNEDLYPSGDITSSLIKDEKIVTIKLISNQNAIVAGLLFAKQTFLLIDNKVKFIKENLIDQIKKQKVNDVFPFFQLKKNIIGESSKSKINKNYVLEISFDNKGLVKSKKLYDINDMNDLDIAKDTTNKTYDTKSRFGKIITSIEQKMNAQKINRKRK